MKAAWLLTGTLLGLGLGLVAAGCGAQSAASHSTAVEAATVRESAVEAVTKDAPAAEPTPPAEPASPVALPAESPPAAAAQVNSDAPQPPQKKRLPADRQPRKPGDAERITFEDLNLGMQPDIAYRPFMLTDRVKELEGQRISIIGYMHEGQLTTSAVKEFVLLKNTECKFGPGGQADHLGMIYLKPGTTTKLTKQPVKVEGTLEIEPRNVDGITWSIYNLREATAEIAR